MTTYQDRGVTCALVMLEKPTGAFDYPLSYLNSLQSAVNVDTSSYYCGLNNRLDECIVEDPWVGV